VRAEADKLKIFIVGFAVDQDQVGLDVAVPMIVPVTRQRVIETPARQLIVIGEKVDDIDQERVEFLAVLS
jgi:hypothetical protein